VVGGVTGEHVGQPGLDADADQGQPAGRLPLLRRGELLVAELDAALGVRALGVRLRQAHRHVEVVGPGGERTLEDRHHEPRVDGVHHVRGARLARQGLDRARVGRVDLGRREARVVDLGDGAVGALLGVVGHDDGLEEVATGRDGAERRADAAGAHQEDPHLRRPGSS
jgi:hypothetical protein